MADSIQRQIMDAISTRAATILVSGGFKTDIGSNVFRWKTKAWESHEMPGISIKDPTTPVQWDKMRGNAGGPGGTWKNLTRVEFQVAIELADDSTNQAVADKVRDAIDDVYKMIAVDITWGGLARWTMPVDHSIDLIEENKTLGGGNIKVDIDFRTLAFNTDAQG